MSAERSFAAASGSVAKARRFVLAAAGDVPVEVQESLVVVVSELATNCVVHARTPFRVHVSRTGHELRLEVADTGGGNVGIRRPSRTETHGRGLQMVNHLADGWGVTYSPARMGKTVWCTFLIRVGAPTGKATSPRS